ncbi:hypothetical protein HY251_01645 [bacterium]|nr:hypothetical protein [bacterium]
MKLSRLAFLAPALLVFLGVAARADDEGKTKAKAKKPTTTFVRFQESEEEEGKATLETAYASYTKAGSDVEVVLYGAVHIADKEYYEKVQKDLDSYEVVLYEMVTPPKDPAKVDENMKTIGELQSAMGEILGFQFQKDGINYKAKNLVHADMTYEELSEATGGDISKALPGAGMFSDPQMAKMLKPAVKFMKQMGKGFLESMGIKDQLKLQLGRQLGNTDISNMPGGEDMQKILIVERNKVALKVLDKELEKRTTGKIAIFYGAAHMKDFHERLADKGWTQKSVSWNAAWTIGKEDKDGGEDDERPAKPEPRKAKKAEPKHEDGDREPVPSGGGTRKKRWL